MRGRVGALAAALTFGGCLISIGCGSSGESGASAKPRLTISAAASLKGAFTAFGDDFAPARARFSFAGSDELAAQIRKGVRPDVFAAANAKLPDRLYKEGLVDKPTVFAGNRLVLAVPADGRRVNSLGDLRATDVKLVVGAPSVPVGSYTRDVLRRLPAEESKAILANVRSQEPDVKGVVGKLTQGAADAGFVYVTDVVATNGRVKAVELPKRLQPKVKYAAAVVKGSKQPRQGRAFIAGLLKGKGLAAMGKAGFEPAPR